MSIQQSQNTLDDKISEKDVETYLKNNPEFFEQNSRLLAELSIPHTNATGATSLIERQVDILRKANAKLQKQLNELIQVARENEILSRKTFDLSIVLLGCDTRRCVKTRVQDSLLRDFNADAVKIYLTPDNSNKESVTSDEQRQAMNRLFERELKLVQPMCARAKPEQTQYLFGEQSEQLQSIAYIPLDVDKHRGFIAIASKDLNRFHAGMGTVFLQQLGQIVSKTFNRVLS